MNRAYIEMRFKNLLCAVFGHERKVEYDADEYCDIAWCPRCGMITERPAHDSWDRIHRLERGREQG